MVKAQRLFLGFCTAIILTATGSAVAKEMDGNPPMLSFPAAAGEAVRREAKVGYVSDGYLMGDCQLVRSSGDSSADAQACKTVSIYKALVPIYATTSVWISPEFQGDFVPPKARNPKRAANAYVYPSNALRQSRQGRASIKLTISATGKLTDCAIVQSSGHADLDKVSCQAQFKTKYEPASLDGEPIEAIIYNVMSWTAGGSPPSSLTETGNFLPKD
tara:strand:+ start:187 stop:837 length:651 start_codon:yes stop_codon:yes gene_type:complete